MRKRDEYQSKVTADTGLTRSRVPVPLLQAIGARPGDQLIFRLTDSGKVVMRLSRARKKAAKGRSKRR
jgi:bifunctional DNA-binding transcriptional regulator/antitoxin component of YhaV-PrlF toxin-antitoxin module